MVGFPPWIPFTATPPKETHVKTRDRKPLPATAATGHGSDPQRLIWACVFSERTLFQVNQTGL